MKKLITLSLALCATLLVQAQSRPVAPALPFNNFFPSTITGGDVAAKPTSISTVVMVTPATVSPSCGKTIYPASVGGYVSGVNGYGDKEKMMRYSLSDGNFVLPATIDTVYTAFPIKYQGGNGSITAKIYAANTDGTPGSLLGTSTPISVSNIDTSTIGAGTVNATRFSFPTPVSLTASQFFVSIDISALYANGDTVALFSTIDTSICTVADTLRAWDKFSDNSFVRVGDASNWNLSIEYGIFPRVTGTNALSILALGSGRFATRCYPSPASSSLQVAFAAKAGSPASITLRDITGKVLATQSISAKAQNTVVFDVSAFRSGLYFCEVSSNGATETVKVSVQ